MGDQMPLTSVGREPFCLLSNREAFRLTDCMVWPALAHGDTCSCLSLLRNLGRVLLIQMPLFLFFVIEMVCLLPNESNACLLWKRMA